MLNKRVDLLQKLSQENLDHIENAFLRNRFGSSSLRVNTRRQITDKRNNFFFSCLDKNPNNVRTDETYGGHSASDSKVDDIRSQRKVGKASSFRETMSKLNVLRSKSNDTKKNVTAKKGTSKILDIPYDEHSIHEAFAKADNESENNRKLQKQKTLPSISQKSKHMKLPEIIPNLDLGITRKMVSSNDDIVFPKQPHEKQTNIPIMVQSNTIQNHKGKSSQISSGAVDSVANKYLKSKPSDLCVKGNDMSKSTSSLNSSSDGSKKQASADKKASKVNFWSTKPKTSHNNAHLEKHSFSWFKKFYGVSPIHEKSGSFEFLNDSTTYKRRKKDTLKDNNQHNDITPPPSYNAEESYQTLDPKAPRKTIYIDDPSHDPLEKVFTKSVNSSEPNLHDLESDNRLMNSKFGRAFETPSFVGVLEEFERTVRMLNEESYLSDSEVYSSRRKSLSKSVSRSSVRMSSSFGALDSPKILREGAVKPSTLTSPFLRQLNGLILEKKIYGSSSSAMCHEKGDSAEFCYPAINRSDFTYAPVKGTGEAEEEWITQDESDLYSKEMRPPFIIPRIKHYIPSRPVNFGHNRLKTSQDDLLFDRSPPNSPGEPLSPSIKEVRKMFEIRSQNENYRNSPSKTSDRMGVGIKLDLAIEKGFVKASSESPKFIRLPQRLGGSNEMLSQKLHNQAPLKSGSGENLVETRGDHQTSLSRNGKAKSFMGQAALSQWSPVSVQRVLPKVYDPNMHALLEGFVNRTKLTENGKKVRKNWVYNYLIMTQTSLAFYKDLRTYQIAKAAIQAGIPPSPTSLHKPDLVLSLHGAVVSRCTSQHTSRYAHACVVTTCQRDQVIIQNDSPAVASHWYEEILKTINKLPSDYICPNNNNIGADSPKDEHHKVTPTATRKNGQKHKLHYHKGGDGSNEDVSELTAEQSNVRAKLRRFFARRPTMDSLVRKGIYKDEPVFGRLLEQVAPDSGHLRVPEFVVRCVRAIEATDENMTTDGLYRASGNLSQVQKIRLEVDQNNLSVLDNEVDVHVLTGALKLFFRELKEPLIPCRLFHKALNASSNPHRDSRVKEFSDMIASVPESNRQTLKYLLEHLLRVTTHKDMNRMHIPNIAIVFGPTLLWAPVESAHNMAMDCLQQNYVIETLLTDFDLIFSDGNARKK